MSEQKGSSFFEGLLIGGALAFVATLLLAQQSGEEARVALSKKLRSLKEHGEDAFEDIKGNARDVLDIGVDVMDRVLARLSVAIDEGARAASERRQQLEHDDHRS